MKVVSFQNHKISYTIDGQGECIVLLHGFPMDHRVWDDFKSSFTPRFKVICIDLPGSGQSEMLNETHSMLLMAKAVNTVLTHENIEKCILLGHSMGGYVSLEFANRFPEKMKGLILFHSQASADDEVVKAKRNNDIQLVFENKSAFLKIFIDGLFDKDFSKIHPKKVDNIKEICQSQSEQAIVAALSGMRDRQSHLDLLINIQVPVLFILGKNDARMPITKIMEQAQLPAHTEILILDHVAHFGFLEKPEVTGLTIDLFAKKCFEWNL
jgi:pimeloyl-ACP methyl ester carboxylesterase